MGKGKGLYDLSLLTFSVKKSRYSTVKQLNKQIDTYLFYNSYYY